MTITAKVICDSISPWDSRLTTLQLRYPRFIHAEFMTHRALSRNASSSRAIPVSRLIQDVLDDTAMPLHWGKNQPGMQAREEHDAPVMTRQRAGEEPVQLYAQDAWAVARDKAIDMARAFDAAGYHKQIVNRLLEPFTHINVVVSATDWDNFFTLRDHPDAQPEIQVLAREIKNAMNASDPTYVGEHQWHLPYVENSTQADKRAIWNYAIERDLDLNDVGRRVSVARCARVSYLTHDGRATEAWEDTALHDKLVVAEPLHASPAEHQATPIWGRDKNFNGWRQYRTTLEAAR